MLKEGKFNKGGLNSTPTTDRPIKGPPAQNIKKAPKGKDLIIKCEPFIHKKMGLVINIWEGIRNRKGDNADKNYNLTDYNILSWDKEKAIVRVTIKKR